MERNKDFDQGLWCAIQELVVNHGSESTARCILTELGYTNRTKLEQMQQHNGAFDEEMNAFIHEYY